MAHLLDDNRIYQPGDPELELIGSRAKLNQWRLKGIGPAHYKLRAQDLLPRKDLNAWAEANRVDPGAPKTAENSEDTRHVRQGGKQHC